MAKSELEKYKSYVSDQLQKITPILQKYAMGDFSPSIPIPEEENEFTELLVGLQLMVDNIREMVKEKDSIISKYKNTETALKESENKFRSITENAVDYIFIKNKKRKYTFVNKAMQDLLGISKNKILGKSPKEIFGSKQGKIIKKIDDRTFSGETVNETRNLTIYNKKHYLNTVQTPLATEDGEVTSIMGIVRDITEYKEAEAALWKIKERYRAVVKDQTELICRFEPDGTFSFVNEAFSRFFNKHSGQLIGNNVKSLMTNEERIKFNNITSSLTMDNPVVTLENSSTLPKGDIRWLQWTIRAMFDEYGELNLFQAVGWDITDRKRTEQELKKSEERLNLAVQSANIGLWDQDFNTGFVTRNRQWAEMLGYTLEEINSDINVFFDLLHPDDKAAVNETIHKHETGKLKSFNIEHRMKTKEGKWKWILNYGKVVKRDSKGKPLRAIGVHIDINERKQVEETLRNAEIEKKIILDSLVEHVIHEDKNMKIIWANQAACKSAGLTREELIGRHCYKIWAKRSDPCPDCPVVKSIKTHKPEEIEKSTPDGRLWFIRGNPVINDQGEVTSGIELTLDITERKKTENALRESEERYRAVVENSHNGVLIVGEDFKFMYVNNTLCRILGYEREEIIGHDFREFLDKKSKFLVKDRYIRRQRGERIPSRYEFNIVRKDGEKRHVEISSTVVKDSRNRIKTIAQILDITDRKRAEESLRESEAKYRSLIENSNDAIYLLYNRKFEIINKKFEELLSVTAEDVQKPDFDFMELVKPEDRSLIKDRMEKVSKGEQVSLRYQFTAVRPDGRELILETSVSYIPYKQGTATQGILRDMTERIHTENQLKDSLKEKEVLLKEIHHRVKNNLNVITSLLNLQSRKIKTKKQAMDAFKESKDRIYAMAMVHEKLYQSGVYSEINMKDYTETLILNLQTIYPPEAKITCTPRIDTINIDISRAIPCGLLLNELITNALKHAFKGRPKGKLVVEFHQLKKGQFEIKVKDNGVGLYNNGSAQKEESLGLHLIDILTKQLDGKLSIKTKKGTEFRIVFPVKK